MNTTIFDIVKKKKSRKSILFLFFALLVIISFSLHVDNVFTYTPKSYDSVETMSLLRDVGYVQEIYAYQGKLKSFRLKFDVIEKTDKGSLQVNIIRDNDVLCSWEVDIASMVDDSLHEFTLDDPLVLKDTSCYIELKNISDSNIAVYTSLGGSGVAVNGVLSEAKSFYSQFEIVNTSQKERYKAVYIVIFGLLVLSGFLVLNTSEMKYSSIIFLFLGVLLTIRVLDYSVFQNLEIYSNIIPASQSQSYDVIQKGDKKKYNVSVSQTSFDELHFFISDFTTNDIKVKLKNKDTGKVYFNEKVALSNINYDVSSQNTCVSIIPGKRMPAGNYVVSIKNRSNEEIMINVLDDTSLNVSVDKVSFLAHKLVMIIIFLVLIMLIFLFGYAIDRFDISKVYLCTIIPLTLVYLILFCPWSIPDAQAHFLASYRCSNIILGYDGEMEWYGRSEDAYFCQHVWGRELNPSVEGYANIIDGVDILCNNSEMMPLPISAEHMEYYSIINYLPEAIAFAIARLLNLSTEMMIYLGRIFVLVFYVLASYYAIRRTPIAKGVFAMVASLPMCLMMSSAISYDGMVIIASLCFYSSVLALLRQNKSQGDIIHTVFWAFLLGSIKGGGYLILLPLLLLLFTTKKNKKAIITIAAIVLAGLISVVIFDVLIPAGSEFFQLGTEGNGKLAATYVFNDPMKFIDMSAEAYIINLDALSLNIAGTHLGWLEGTMPSLVIILLLVMIGLYSITEQDDVVFEEKSKKVFLLIIFIGIVSTPAMLLSWTDVGSRAIMGLQGRYYLPFLPCVYFVCTKYTLYAPIKGVKGNLARKKILTWFYLMSCIAVFYMMRLYFTR